MASSFRSWPWRLAVLAACAGCAGPASQTQPTQIVTEGSFTPAGSTPSLWASLLPGRQAAVSAANNDAARNSRTIPDDDPLSLRYTPNKLGPDVHVHAARVYESQGRLEQAFASYEKALQAGPTDLGALVGMARLHDRRGNYTDATQWYQRALTAHPSCAAAHNDLGLCYAREGQIAASIDVLQQAVRLDPQQALYRNNLAKVLVEAQRVDEAYEHLAAVFPPAAAHYNLGFLMREAGRPELAVVAFERSLAADPAFTRAGKLLDLTRTELAQRPAALAGPQFPPQAAPRPQNPQLGSIYSPQAGAPAVHMPAHGPYAQQPQGSWAPPNRGDPLLLPPVNDQPR